MNRIEFETALHLCGLVSRFFDNIAESYLEYGDDFDTSKGAFVDICKDFTFDPDERAAAEIIEGRVLSLARTILKFAD